MRRGPVAGLASHFHIISAFPRGRRGWVRLLGLFLQKRTWLNSALLYVSLSPSCVFPEGRGQVCKLLYRALRR